MLWLGAAALLAPAALVADDAGIYPVLLVSGALAALVAAGVTRRLRERRGRWRRLARLALALGLVALVVGAIAAMSLQPGLGDLVEVALAVAAALFGAAALARAVDVPTGP